MYFCQIHPDKYKNGETDELRLRYNQADMDYSHKYLGFLVFLTAAYLYFYMTHIKAHCKFNITEVSTFEVIIAVVYRVISRR